MEWKRYELFWSGYLTDPLTVASVAPDSKWCVEILLRHAHMPTVDLILEYGPASGAVTDEIIRRKKPATNLICVEKDRSFFPMVKTNIQSAAESRSRTFERNPQYFFLKKKVDLEYQYRIITLSRKYFWSRGGCSQKNKLYPYFLKRKNIRSSP